MQSQLLAASGWILDLFFLLILIFFTTLGAHRGLLKEVSRIAGKVASLIIAVLFCASFANILENLFHLTSAIASGIANQIAKNDVYGIAFLTDIPGAQIKDALAQIGIGAIPRWLISKYYAGTEFIPAGTTAAQLISIIIARWISIPIAFVILIVVIRLGVFLIQKVFSSVIERVEILHSIDKFLGALFGFLKACLISFILLSILYLLPIATIPFMESSWLVGKIVLSEWFRNAVGYIFSGNWLWNSFSKLSNSFPT